MKTSCDWWLRAYVLCLAIPPWSARWLQRGPSRRHGRRWARLLCANCTKSRCVPMTADRGFCGYEFWRRGMRTGAKLLFRVKKSQSLPRLKVLPDGSYLSEISSNKNLKQKVQKTLVRVIEYTLDGIPDAEVSYRLITNWMGEDAPAVVELAALYHRRWTIEQSFHELKTHLADRKVILRSKTPELVRQEFYALLLAHAAIRKLKSEAADHTQQSAGDLSFVHAVRVLQRRLPSVGAIPPSASA